MQYLPPKFKIRASAISKIMTEPRSKKDKESGGLSKTTQSYCKQWLKEQSLFYNRRKEFDSKYTDKGNITEDGSIEFIEAQLDYLFLEKNEQWYSDEYMTGTPDVVLNDHLIDVKNSWDWSTFPLFEKEIPNKDYWWQGQGYMHLTGRKKYKLIYVLSDTPDELIWSEAKRQCYKNGLDLDEYGEEVFQGFKTKMTYPDIPDELKIKVYEFEYDKEAVQKVIEQVKKCRLFIKELCNKQINSTETKAA